MAIEREAPRTAAEKQKAAEAAFATIEKDHGKGSIFDLSKKVGMDWPHIPTGLIGLDHTVLGIGGIPRGRITEIYGPESGGKTTLTLHTIASAQRAGELCAFIDAENALDPTWANKIGVDVGKLAVSQPDNGEQALEIVQTLIESQAFGVVVVDSVAALVPKAELDGDMGDAHMGLQARLMSQAMRKLSGAVARSNTALIFINQIRDKIGVMFGSPETTTGGRALKFYASLRLDVRRVSGIKIGDEVTGNQVRIKTAKNKMAPPYRDTVVELKFDRGFDTTGNLVSTAVDMGVVEKSGSWLSYKGERLGQGQENARELLDNNKDLYAKILKDTSEKLK